MCYDISYQITLESLEDYFGNLVFDDPQSEIDFTPIEHSLGVAVYPEKLVVYHPKDTEQLHCKKMEWGVIRYFDKEEPLIPHRNMMLNIRSERVLDDKTSYWYKIRNRRCILLTSATFEHRGIVGWKKKVPYLIRPKGAHVFGIPGLYSVAEIPDKITGELIKRWTFAIMTCDANEVMRNIHNDGDNRYRMPLYLPHAMSMEFVRNDLPEDRLREILSYRIPSADMDYWPVWTIRSSNERPDGKCKTDHFDWPNLPPLGEGNPPIKEMSTPA